MPIHDQGYRRRDAPAADVRRFRALPIARLTARQILARRALVVLAMISLIPFLMEAAVLFMMHYVPDIEAFLSPLPKNFGRCQLVQIGFALLLTVWGGTGLIADDLRSGALLVYFSRPLTRADYVLGKLAVLLALNLAVTALPMLLLWLVAVAFDSRDLVGRGLAFLPGSIVALALVASFVLSVLALALGAVTRSATIGGGVLVGLFVLFQVAALLMPPGARVPLHMLSITQHLVVVEQALFQVPPEPGALHWLASSACLVLIVWGAGAVLWKRLQAVEVVS
jgi:ABC-type transport system involved in multi-copper enzyme maturation permease subunit